MAPPTLQTFLLAVEDNGIATVKFNRARNANALNSQVMSDMLQALTWALEEPKAKVVVLTGEGKFFSAGLDLVSVPPEGPAISDDAVEALRCDIFHALRQMGLCAEACSSVTLQRVLGRQKAASLILAGERMTPQELESAGLITKILPKDGFLDAVMEIAKRIAAQPTGALKYSKNLMMEPIRADLLAANERECQGLRERGRTAEPREAIAAFEREQEAKKKAKL